jgi:hypothetical protein
MNAFRLTPTPSARTVPTPRHRFLWKKKGSVRPTCSRRRKDWRHWFSAGVAGYPGFVEASPRGLVSCAQLLDRVAVDAFVRAFRCSGFGRSRPWPWRTAATACMNRSFVSSTSTSASVDPRSCPRLPSVPSCLRATASLCRANGGRGRPLQPRIAGATRSSACVARPS